MIVYYLILRVNHRDTQLIIYLLPALHYTHDPVSLHNDLHLQCPPAHCASSRGALISKHHQRFRGISKATGALQYDPSRRLLLSSLAVKQAPGENAAALHEDKMKVGGSDGRGVAWSLYYISVHSWVGREERARRESCLTSFHSLSSLSLDGRPAVASVIDLRGYTTLGKLEFGNSVGQCGKNKNTTTVEQHCRLCKHILLTLLVLGINTW